MIEKITLQMDMGIEEWLITLGVNKSLNPKILEEDFQPDDYCHRVMRSLTLNELAGGIYTIEFTDKKVDGIEDKTLPNIAIYHTDTNDVKTCLTGDHGMQTIPGTLMIFLKEDHESVDLRILEASRKRRDKKNT